MREITKCPYCLGSGKEYSSGHITVDGWQDADTCSRCYGTGESNKDSVTTASPGALNPKDSPKCPECGGEHDGHGHRITTVAEAEALLTLVKGAEPGSLTPKDSCSLAPGLNTAKDDELETLLIVLQVETEHANHQQLVIDTARETVKAAIQTYATNQTIEVLEDLLPKTPNESLPIATYRSNDWRIGFYKGKQAYMYRIKHVIKELKERL